MASIEFHLRSSSRVRRSAGSVFIRVIHRRESGTVTTPWKLYPEEWDPLERKVVFSSYSPQRYPYLKEVERELEKTYEFLLCALARLGEEGEFTASDVTAFYRRRMSGSLLSSYVDKLSEELISEGRERTARGYRTVRNGLLHFYGNNDLSFKQVTSSLMHRFQSFMLGEGKEMNTISFYMRNLRAIYNRAVRQHLTEAKTENPFAGVYTGVHATKKRALSKKDMALLEAWDPFTTTHGIEGRSRPKHGKARITTAVINKEKNIRETPCSQPVEGLRQAQLLFLFSFLSRGMSFVDMAYLKKEDIKEGTIRYRRKKTRQLLEITVTPRMQTILDRFAGETADSPYVFPLIRIPGENERLQYESALRTQNNRLKRLAALLKVKSEKLKAKRKAKDATVLPDDSSLFTFHFSLSSHVARHTWATIARAAEIPIGVISEGLGHTSERTTMIYLGSFDTKVLDRANRKVEKFIKSA